MPKSVPLLMPEKSVKQTIVFGLLPIGNKTCLQLAMRTLKIVALTLLASFALSSCGGGSEQPLEQTTQEKYLSEINEVKQDAFVSDNAALMYLRNYCQAEQTGIAPSGDAIDQIVSNYCDTDLAKELGVTEAPEPEPTIDLESYKQRALDEFGVGQVEADGSKIDAVAFGQSLCSADLELMISNLGDDFESSFQYFALSTFCPEKIELN